MADARVIDAEHFTWPHCYIFIFQVFKTNLKKNKSVNVTYNDYP